MLRLRTIGVLTAALAMLLVPLAPAAAAGSGELTFYHFGDTDEMGQEWVGQQDIYDYVTAYFSFDTRATRTLTVTGTNVVLAGPQGNDENGAEASCAPVTQTKLSCSFSDASSGGMSFRVIAGNPGTGSVTISMAGATNVSYAFAVRPLSAPLVKGLATPGEARIRANVALGGSTLPYALVTATRTAVDSAEGITDIDGNADIDLFDVPPTGADYQLQVAHRNREYLASTPVKVTVKPSQSAASLTMTVAAIVKQDQYLKVATQLTPGRADWGFETLRLQSRPYGSKTWTTIHEESSTDGGAVAWVRLATTSELRWEHPASFAVAYAVSPTATVAVIPDSTVMASPVIAPPGSTTTLTMHTGSQSSGRVVTLQEYVRGSWRKVADRTPNSAGDASWQVRLPTAGVRTWRVQLSATSVLPVGTTANVKVTTTLAGAGRKSDFSFLGGSSSRPAHWSRCRPITYRTNVSQATPGARADVVEALRRISLYTKVRFKDLGATRGIPQSLGRQPEMLRIGWAKSGRGKGHSPDLSGYELGRGGSQWRGTTMFRGMVALDSKAKLPGGFGAGATRGALLLHEISHVMGLNHASTRTQVMYPILSNNALAAVFGAGDIAGLTKLGRAGRC